MRYWHQLPTMVNPTIQKRKCSQMGASRDWTIYERQKSQNNVNIGIIRTNYSILYTSILFVLNIRPKRHHKRKKRAWGKQQSCPTHIWANKIDCRIKGGTNIKQSDSTTTLPKPICSATTKPFKDPEKLDPETQNKNEIHT